VSEVVDISFPRGQLTQALCWNVRERGRVAVVTAIGIAPYSSAPKLYAERGDVDLAGERRYRLPPFLEVGSVAKPELGNKHHCQNCGARFFDLNKSPIRCPNCGAQAETLPLVAQHMAGSSLRAKGRFSKAAVADHEATGAETELDPREEADGEDDKVAVVADDDVQIDAGDETLLEEEEEDAGDLIDGEIGDEVER
jgi:uncharacterized protein (TIGR02300 family)